MPIQIKKKSSMARQVDPTVDPGWLMWMPAAFSVMGGILFMTLMAPWVTAASIGYALLLLVLSFGYGSAWLRALARLLLLAVPLLWAFVAISVARDLIAQEVTGWQMVQYYLYQACQMLAPFMMPVIAGTGFCAACGRRFDNNLLRVYSLLTLALLLIGCIYFRDGVDVPSTGRVLYMNFGVEAEWYRIVVCVLAAAIALLSFAVYPPFAERLDQFRLKKEEEQKQSETEQIH